MSLWKSVASAEAGSRYTMKQLTVNTLSYVYLANDIRVALKTLPEKHRRVIEMRYGLNGEGEMTLGEIAEEMGLTRERIRQIEYKALRMLRQPGRGLFHYGMEGW